VKVFISSVVAGLEQFRDSAARAAAVLGHEVKRSEDFGASSETPQQACLAGVRWAEVVVLLLGARYGDPQPSGLSATHEEYREAKSRCPILAFVQTGAEREARQQEFIGEVGAWAGGVLTGRFTTAEELDDAVTRDLHGLELSRQAGPPDEGEIIERARALIPDRSGWQGAAFCVATAAGPRQQVLRPSELGDASLERELHREVLLGDDAVFDTTQGVSRRITGDAFILQQQGASLVVDQLGSVCVLQPAADRAASGLPALIEEDIEDRLNRSFRLTAFTLDRIDPVKRLSHVGPVVALLSGEYLGWRTRDEHARSPQSMEMPTGVGDRVVVGLAPPMRPRAALIHEAPQPVDHFVALLRRAYRR
jgi:hypothetical protein